MSWKTLSIAAVVVILAVLLWRRTSAQSTEASPADTRLRVITDAPPRPEQLLTIGQKIVLNALGVGEVTGFTVGALRDGGTA